MNKFVHSSLRPWKLSYALPKIEDLIDLVRAKRNGYERNGNRIRK